MADTQSPNHACPVFSTVLDRFFRFKYLESKIMRGACYLCSRDMELSVEHVIPQCLGGVLKANLYCAECNNRCGQDIDAELAKQFGRFATLLCIDRERGENQPFEVITEGADEIRLRCDGKGLTRVKPEITPRKHESGKLEEAEIIARSESELHKIAKSLAAKYNFHVESWLFTSTEIQNPTGVHEYVIENALIRRAVAKIAYGLACIRLPKQLVSAAAFDPIRRFVMGMDEKPLASANFADGSFMVDNYRPLHKIHLRYEMENRLLIGYVALFGTFRFTVVLGEGITSEVEWAGIDYTYNPVTRRAIAGNGNFVAPSIGKARALQPNHSRQTIIDAITKGQDVIAAHSEILVSPVE